MRKPSKHQYGKNLKYLVFKDLDNKKQGTGKSSKKMLNGFYFLAQSIWKAKD